MDFIDFIAGCDDNGKKISFVLRRILENHDAKKNNVFIIIRKNLVHLNGKKIKSDERIIENDKISIAKFLISKDTTQEDESKIFSKINFNIETIFKNPHIWIVNKPAGITSQKGSLNDFSISEAIQRQSQSNSLSFNVGPLHRIDKMTSGILCFSQSIQGARWFSNSMKNHLIKKTYIAIIENTLPQKSVCFNEMINGKNAKTFIEELSRGSYIDKKVTLVKIQPQTGRKHQIRIHCALHGCPLLGDVKYGGTKLDNFFLHAKKMYFPENPLGIPREVNAPIPQTWNQILTIFPSGDIIKTI